MTRILHLIPALSGGGAERQLSLLAPAQVAREHDVHIASLTAKSARAFADEPGVHYHTLQVRGHYDPTLALQIRSLIQRTKPDVVQTWLTLMDIAGGSAAKMARTPWVLSERSEAAAYPSSIKNNLRARLGRRADAIIANSQRGVEYWTAQRVPRVRLVHVPNAVGATTVFGKGAPLPPEVHGRPFVLFVGRLSQEKRPVVVVHALSRVLPKLNAAAIICGSGQLESQLQSAVERCGMQGRIVMAGQRADVHTLLQQARVCVAVSVFEGHPNVVLEAMAAGCPLVVSNIPAYRALLSDNSALFVPVDDVAATARAIEDVFTHPERAAARALLAIQNTAALTPTIVAERIDGAYKRVLERRRARRAMAVS